MPLMNEVLEICQRYAQKGWGRYLKDNFGLDINQPTANALAKELQRDLHLSTQHFEIPGFHDLSRNTHRGIERGNPANSLLYHAFFSPAVQPFEKEDYYLTTAELEVLENFVWVASEHGVEAPTYEALLNTKIKPLLPFRTTPDVAVVILSQEYRQGHESVHRRHADLAFSRTGVARVGTKDALYVKKIRGYWPAVEGEPKSIRALPAKYAPYLAVKLTGNQTTFGPLAMQDTVLDKGDNERAFWVPIHKLFSSENECIQNFDLRELQLEAHHVNEKIRRVHLEFNKRGAAAETNLDTLSQRPYFITDNIATVNEEGYLTPVAAPLVQIARNAEHERITFEVPRRKIDFFDESTLNISAGKDDGSRSAPEYVHVRRTAGETEAEDRDENDNPAMTKKLLTGTDQNPRRAVHYSDSTGDGWVTLTKNSATAVLKKFKVLPSYSLVTAPDFYPLVAQYPLMRWHNTQARPVWIPDRNPPAPDALSNQRFAANINLMQDSTGNPVPAGTAGAHAVFDAQDDTMTAIISLPNQHTGQAFSATQFLSVMRNTGLPDGASGVYAPGWDVSYDVTDGVSHLAAYGLGSPFPEDAKLCAALSSFWPAAAPDTAITFNITNSVLGDRGIRNRIIVPMTAEEITGAHPWDGVQGPQISKINDTEVVTYPKSAFVDYVSNAANEAFSLDQTAAVTLDDYTRRILVQQRVDVFLRSSQMQDYGVLYKDYNVLSVHNRNGLFHYEFATVEKDKQLPAPVKNQEDGHRFFCAPIINRFAVEVGPDNIPHLVTPISL